MIKDILLHLLSNLSMQHHFNVSKISATFQSFVWAQSNGRLKLLRMLLHFFFPLVEIVFKLVRIVLLFAFFWTILLIFGVRLQAIVLVEIADDIVPVSVITTVLVQHRDGSEYTIFIIVVVGFDFYNIA